MYPNAFQPKCSTPVSLDTTGVLEYVEYCGASRSGGVVELADPASWQRQQAQGAPPTGCGRMIDDTRICLRFLLYC